MSLTEEVKLSKAGVLLIIAGVVLFNFTLLFAGLFWVGRSSQPELNAIQIQETREDIQAVNVKLEAVQKMLSDQAVKDAEIKGRDFGYRVGRADKRDGH